MSEPISTIEQLVAAREARGFSSDDMLRALKIAPRQLESLERGDWAALPGTPFVRGVLRVYARTLEADITPLLETVGGRVQPNELKPAGPLDEPLRSRGMLGFGSGGSGHRLVWVGLVLLGVLAFALFFGRGTDFSAIPSWFDTRGANSEGATSTTPERSEAAVPGSTVETISLPGVPGVPGGAGVAGAASAGSTPPGQTGAGPTGPGPTAGAESGAGAAAPAASGVSTAPAGTGAAGTVGSVAPANAPAGAEVASTGSLRLSFAVESWVDVKQADGKVLLSGLQRASTSQTLNPSGTVTLVIGNAAGVTLEFAGKPVDLKPHIRGSIARLTLP